MSKSNDWKSNLERRSGTCPWRSILHSCTYPPFIPYTFLIIQDYSPRTLTQFGYNEVASDLTVSQGGVLYRVLMRAFPGWYEYNSIYALFPLTIPSENRKILRGLGKESLYSFNRPTAPVRPYVLSTAQSARKILTH